MFFDLMMFQLLIWELLQGALIGAAVGVGVALIATANHRSRAVIVMMFTWFAAGVRMVALGLGLAPAYGTVFGTVASLFFSSSDLTYERLLGGAILGTVFAYLLPL